MSDDARALLELLQEQWRRRSSPPSRVGVHDDQVDALSLAFSKLEQTDLSVWLKLAGP
jgi:hypothetical protein